MYRLELSEQMMMVIFEALGEHPFRAAAPVIGELQRQVNSQRMAQANGQSGEQHLSSP